jgi:hypothetical protein
MRLPRHPLCALLASGLVAGCGTSAGSGPPAPRSITVSQARELPLEEAGDLSIRQNLAERPGKPILGKDRPTTTASR